MDIVLQARGPVVRRAAPLRLFARPREAEQTVSWRINGFRARLHVWTEDEWQKLDARPTDAQKHPSGIWCALRID